MICECPSKHDPNIKKDSNPVAPTILHNEMLATLNESRNSTLLQTTYPKDFNNELPLNSPTHIMFDSSSQKSYITVDLKKQLQLETIPNEKIIIKTFRSTEGKVSVVDVANVKIKCRNNKFDNMEALCVPVICSPLMGRKSFKISKTHTTFRKLYLRDFTMKIEEKNISILIGLDHYFLFIKGNIIHSANDNLQSRAT